jgi:hypothetical protein
LLEGSGSLGYTIYNIFFKQSGLCSKEKVPGRYSIY